MSIYKNGKKLDEIYVGGKKVSKIFRGGGVIYSSGPKIVSFHDGTDAELAAMLNAHYAGQINISDYWKVGDTRVVHINATNSGIMSHVEQNMTMIIYGFDHDDLTTPINDKTKAAVTIGFREVMGNNGTAEEEYYWGSPYFPVENSDNYLASPLREWLNGDLLNALPLSFSSMIKQVDKKCLQMHTLSSPEIASDKMWLLSYPETFGNVENDNYIDGQFGSLLDQFEGPQYEYMKNSANRIKKVNNNGVQGANSYAYFLRSPSSYNFTTSGWGYFWFKVNTNGTAETNAAIVVSGLAPVFCL